MTPCFLEIVLGYLVNSLWQVPLIFMAAWLVTRLLKWAGPRVAHRVWVGAMALEVLLPACRVDVAALWSRVLSLAFGAGPAAGGTARVVRGAGAVVGTSALHLPPHVLAGVIAAYACSLLYFAARLAWGLRQTLLMRRSAVPIALKQAFAKTGVPVAISSMVAGPSTIGFRRPLLLLTRDFVKSVDEREFDAALAHELAHIERHDYAKNLLYQFFSLPIAWHPVLRLTRARVTETREMVCDAMAAETIDGRESYARSLLRLASLQVAGTQPKTICAIGMFGASHFERRIMNLTEKCADLTVVQRTLMGALCAALALGACGTALALRVDVAAPAQKSGSDSSANETIYSVGNGVSAPTLIHSVDPEFPKNEKTTEPSGYAGVCILNLVVDQQGGVVQAKIAKGLRPAFDAAAVEAVRQYKFKPSMRNGEPVAVSVTIEVNFRKY